MSKDKLSKYVVVALGLTTKPGQKVPHPLGTVVELTEKQAAARVNKVRLKSEMDEKAGGGVAADARLVKRAETAEKEADTYRNKVEAAAGEIKDLKAQVEKLTDSDAGKAVEALTTQVAELEAVKGKMGEAATAGSARIAELEATNGQLADQLAKAAKKT